MAEQSEPVEEEAAEPAQMSEAAEPESQEIRRESRRSPKYWWQWLRAKRSRTAMAVIGLLLMVGAGTAAATDLKYPLLGTFVTTTFQVKVTDAATKQPVPKANVAFAGVTGTTDIGGLVSLKPKPGRGRLRVSKTGYTVSEVPSLAPLTHRAVVSVALKPNGIKVTAKVTNGITGGSVEGVEVKSGDASALTDKDGQAELSLPVSTNHTKQTLSLSRDGFNAAELNVQVGANGPAMAKMTPAGKVYFQSNRTGRIDIYGANLDGTGLQIVLAGTGTEDSATGILVNINDPHTLALVSSRDGRRDGGLHHDLFIFNTENKKLSKIDKDVEFSDFRAWIGSTLVYTQNPNPNLGYCPSIKTYDATAGKTSTFFAGSYGDAGCPAIKLALDNGFLYSVRTAGDNNRVGIFSAKLAGGAKRISPSYSDNTVQRAKKTLLSEYYSGSGETWDSINLDGFAVTRLQNGPSIETSRYYNDSPDGSRSAFIEERDGKSDVYLTDGDGNDEMRLTNIGSANQFVQWYGSDYLVFSSTATNENALYIVAVSGGAPVKISDFYRGNQRTYGGGGNPYF